MDRISQDSPASVCRLVSLLTMPPRFRPWVFPFPLISSFSLSFGLVPSWSVYFLTRRARSALSACCAGRVRGARCARLVRLGRLACFVRSACFAVAWLAFLPRVPGCLCVLADGDRSEKVIVAGEGRESCGADPRRGEARCRWVSGGKNLAVGGEI